MIPETEWEEGYVKGRKEREDEVSKAWIKFTNRLDKIINEYTNGFGDEDINKLMDEFQKQIKEQKA